MKLVAIYTVFPYSLQNYPVPANSENAYLVTFDFTVKPFLPPRNFTVGPFSDFTVHDFWVRRWRPLGKAVAPSEKKLGCSAFSNPHLLGLYISRSIPSMNALICGILVARVYPAVSSIPLDCHEPQVGGSVVQRLVILMIDVLPQRQRSHPQRLAHDLPCVVS